MLPGNGGCFQCSLSALETANIDASILQFMCQFDSKQYLFYNLYISFNEPFLSIYHSVQIQTPAAREITDATSSAQFHLTISPLQKEDILPQISNRCFKFLFHVRFHVSSKICSPFLSSLKKETFAQKHTKMCTYFVRQ